MKHKIMVSDGLSPDGLARLGQEAEVSVQPKITAADLFLALPDYDALIVRSRTKVTADLLKGGDRLKVVGRAGVGVDNIDLAATAARFTECREHAVGGEDRLVDAVEIVDGDGVALALHGGRQLREQLCLRSQRVGEPVGEPR